MIIVRNFDKIDRGITAPHCIVIGRTAGMATGHAVATITTAASVYLRNNAHTD